MAASVVVDIDQRVTSLWEAGKAGEKRNQKKWMRRKEGRKEEILGGGG